MTDWQTMDSAPRDGTVICKQCGSLVKFPHDHRPDGSGLDDGPELRPKRKRPEPKSPEVMAFIRRKAWATRRQKYGKDGHS